MPRRPQQPALLRLVDAPTTTTTTRSGGYHYDSDYDATGHAAPRCDDYHYDQRDWSSAPGHPNHGCLLRPLAAKSHNKLATAQKRKLRNALKPRLGQSRAPALPARPLVFRAQPPEQHQKHLQNPQLNQPLRLQFPLTQLVSRRTRPLRTVLARFPPTLAGGGPEVATAPGHLRRVSHLPRWGTGIVGARRRRRTLTLSHKGQNNAR